MAYSLFWCPIEYFVWSFVTVNHMLHHWKDQQPHSEPLKHSNSNHRHSMPAHGTLLNMKVSSVAQVIASRAGSVESVHDAVIRRRNSSMLFVQDKEEKMELNPMAFTPAMSPNIASLNTLDNHEFAIDGDENVEL